MKIFLMISILLLTTACPKFAYIKLYNNTGVDIVVGAQGDKYTVKPEQCVQFPITGKEFSVVSELGRWIYQRSIPIENDTFVDDDVLKVQVNADGAVYALRTDQTFPITNSLAQPKGYPLYGHSK